MPRIVMILLALLAGFAGLFMSACGGIVLISSLGELTSGGVGLLLFALLMTLVGVGLCWLALRWIAGPSRGAPPPDQEPDHQDRGPSA